MLKTIFEFVGDPLSVHRRQPSTVPAIRIDAHEMASAEDLAVPLGCVAYDGRLAGNVRPRNFFADALP